MEEVSISLSLTTNITLINTTHVAVQKKLLSRIPNFIIGIGELWEQVLDTSIFQINKKTISKYIFTVRYKVWLSSSYWMSPVHGNVIQESHACQYQCKHKVIYINPVSLHICITNSERQQTQLCKGYDPWKVSFFTWPIYSSWTNRTCIQTFSVILPVQTPNPLLL